MDGQRPCWATIDLTALRANLALAQELAGARTTIAVVKADAYGHGAIDVARGLLEAGCERLAVLSVDEAAELREAAVGAPILVLGGVHDEREAAHALSLHVTAVVHHVDGLRWLDAAARRAGTRARVHVEVDTGMRRMGVTPEEAPGLLAQVDEEPALELEGVFSHFARADELDLAPSLEQLRRFREVLAAAAERGVRPPMVHVDNSAGLLAGKVLGEALPEATAVRPGLMLYGVRPAAHLGEALRAVMTLYARVVHVHDVAIGQAVGYGATWRAERPTRVATLSVGYADGVARAQGGSGRVWIAGSPRSIVGRVSMDYISVDVGSAPVRVGDTAIVFGGDVDEGIPVEEAADAAGTVAYELLVRVGGRVPRRLVEASPAGGNVA